MTTRCERICDDCGGVLGRTMGCPDCHYFQTFDARKPVKMVHWRRPLKDGVEFHFAAGTEKMTGSISPASNADGLQAVCEKAWGVKLPEPEWKAARS